MEREKVLEGFDRLCRRYDYVTAEGSGGVLCPLRFDGEEGEKLWLEDVLAARRLPCVVVADAGLGAINAVGHAVTVASRRVYEGFYDDDPAHALMHGPTFMGNALACSVALKSIELFEREDYMAKIRRIEAITRREMAGFAHPQVKEVRILGACVCIEVHDPSVLRGYGEFAYERGVFSRPFLRYLYAMVPYVIEEEELVTVLGTMKEWFRRR